MSDNDLEVTQTCHKCGEVIPCSPAGAEYIQRYGCFKCRQREQDERDAFRRMND